MADTPELTKPSSKLPYLAAALIFVLMGVALVLGVLHLRPQVDALILIGGVVGFMGTIGTAAMAFMKAQETHLTVNSQLSAWKKEFYALAHAQGEIAGAQGEQARIAEQKRVAALISAGVAGPAGVAGAAGVAGPAGPAGVAGAAGGDRRAPASTAPAEVILVNPKPIPVENVVTDPIPVTVVNPEAQPIPVEDASRRK